MCPGSAGVAAQYALVRRACVVVQRDSDRLAARRPGEKTSSTSENHRVLKGLRDIANTSSARIVAVNLFGLSKSQRARREGGHRGETSSSATSPRPSIA